MDTKLIAAAVLEMDVESMLADQSGAHSGLILAMRNGDEAAQHMFRCVMENDAVELRRAAKQYGH